MRIPGMAVYAPGRHAHLFRRFVDAAPMRQVRRAGKIDGNGTGFAISRGLTGSPSLCPSASEARKFAIPIRMLALLLFGQDWFGLPAETCCRWLGKDDAASMSCSDCCGVFGRVDARLPCREARRQC